MHQALHAETPLTLVIDDVQNVASSWVDLVLSGRADTARRMAAAVPDGVRSAAELHLAGAWVATQQGALDVAGAELAEARRAPIGSRGLRPRGSGSGRPSSRPWRASGWD